MTGKNPFTINPIKKKEEFIGRKNLISDVKKSLSRQENCHIVGERKSGKTSFLYRMAEEYKEEKDTKFILLDMQQLKPYSPEEILGRIAHYIDRDLPEKEMSCKEFEIFIRGNKHSTKYKTVILAFDEISALLEKKEVDSSFIEFLRGISGNFDMVFLTTHREGIYEITKDNPQISSPFFNIFRKLYLEYFTEEESKELIQKGGKKFSEEYEKWILEKAYHHPFLLQLICLTLFDYHKENGEDKESIFSSTEEEIYKTLEDHFKYWYERSLEDEERVLGKIISGKGKISRDEESIAQHLERRLLIYKKANRYHLISPLFKRIIKVEKKALNLNYWMILLFLVFGLILSWRMKDLLFLVFYVCSLITASIALIYRNFRR